MHPIAHLHAPAQRRLRIGRRRRAPECRPLCPSSVAGARRAPEPVAAPLQRARHRARSERWQLGVIVAAIVAIGAIWMLEKPSDLSSFAELRAGERHALYDRAFTDVRRLCQDPAPAAARHCAHQAELLAALPECTDECRELVSRWLPRATR